ncbi:Uu.00g090430.m01.CDS01 [Anthostomella pinea]|uniref:Uu.00g090430.m01.CDS01 n=1 Tax=Anthostomella pinea TaxID=933095 RepID=A0AAI8VNK2_9PEZI|nr:Uu.00g090430.m01.CDS01 [Anthostomella pinea]
MALTFDNILNFRDVGKTVNDYLGRRIVKEGVLYRSARPDDATEQDRRRLTDELGIKTVIDLRTKTEHLKQAEKRRADLQVPALLQSNATLARPVQIPGLRYREIKVTGGAFEKFLLSQLSWWNYLKLISLYVSGHRMEAISLLGREVMQPRGLVGLGLITMDASGSEIAEGLRTFTDPSSVPALVHCTQGKDRTGLIIALTLMVLGVPVEAMSHDYLLSRAGLEAEKETRLAEIRELGLTPEWGDCPEDFVVRVHEHVNTKYGGIDGYLDSIEFGKSERQKLVQALGA